LENIVVLRELVLKCFSFTEFLSRSLHFFQIDDFLLLLNAIFEQLRSQT
jgi:hypothetical protein